METLKLEILGTPSTKQSVRSRAIQRNGKWVAMSHKDPKVIQAEMNARAQIVHQLPAGFKPFEGPLEISVTFRFSMPASMPKKKQKSIKDGIAIAYKQTRPDLVDNLMKGLSDCMNGVVFIDDAQICKVQSQKIFSDCPGISIELREIEAILLINKKELAA